MRNAGFLLLTLLLLVVQDSLIVSPGFHVDVSCAVVVYLALERPVLSGAVLAMVVGYLSDVFATTAQGLYGFIMVATFFGVRLPMSRIQGSRFVLVTAVGMLAAASGLLLAGLLEWSLGEGRVTAKTLAGALPSVVIGAIFLTYPCYRLFRALDERLKERDEEFVFKR